MSATWGQAAALPNADAAHRTAPGDLRRRHSAGGDRTDVPGIAESMGIGSVLHPVCTDLKELWDGAPLGQLDLVTCNPPYKAHQAGIESQLNGTKNCTARGAVQHLRYPAARQNGCCGSAADSASATARNGWQTAWMPCGKTTSNPSGCSLWRKRRTHSRGCSCWRAEAAGNPFLNVLPQRIVGNGSGVTTRI